MAVEYVAAATPVNIKDVDALDKFETESEEIPQAVLDELKAKYNWIYYAFFFLDGAVMWAYFSCLSAQDFYATKYPSVKFSFLTTMFLTWPLSLGYVIQMWGGLDHALGHRLRMIIGFSLIAATGVVIIIHDWFDLSETTGAYLCLSMFAVSGAAHSVSEPVLYIIAGLFPDEKFTNAVQIGDSMAGCVNVVAATIIRLIVGGYKSESGSTAVNVSFYLFMGLLVLVSFLAIYIHEKLSNIPAVKYLLDRADRDHKKKALVSLRELWSNYFRVAKLIAVPLVAQYMMFFCTLTLFPGIGCTSSMHVIDPKSNAIAWYCSPGIIASFSFGDLAGRYLCNIKGVWSFFSAKSIFVISFARWVWLPLLLMGLYASPLYAFIHAQTFGLFWQIIMYFLFGITGGMFATVTIGMAPLMVSQADRQAASALMVMALYLGLSTGSTFGYAIGNNHYFNVGL
ncbi:hypothetical protein DYB26_006145 [Aphanomyces astaci]|uniref:Major facilitator superfamily (MFS) profile domain-containing protein n=1 Tax=Aphanomyces astaci TaxID=112090 RepID=A0A396ZXK6_APHAT|nr:hypothetical protein DYB36_010396 [Aphanomyces astaci]RHY42873.1 hypothetical protein DYB38_005941 [Aphanomyces astaci]RHY65100.1 hypothetical protein DYB34_013921 [Aphanomyces astaci]RHY79076.1 hypothetical protein DYB31_013142 [Aphanomyces astaci]RHZ38762.1 hypothetical protein DYB26_006145 [Aphanomyces astaci]